MMFLRNKKRHNSTTSIATNKGLLNKPGENNCFLNSAIQVLWHLDVFRRSFRRLSGHNCMGASCIFCALQHIFQQFQYSKDQALPPTVLRSALAETFQEENRFQLGFMDDAAECFENILNRIHIHIGNSVREDQDVCTSPHCIPHQKFGLALVEQSVCACGATSEPFSFIEMVHYVSATALCAENEAMGQHYGNTQNISSTFGELIKVAGNLGDLRSCPSDCGAKIEMRKVLMNCPDVVSIGIVWDSEEPEVQQIVNLVHTLGTTLRLADLFHTAVDERANHLELYLVGMVCYYGKHYSTFFFHTKLRKWVYFDDAQVSEVGKRWSNVISKCIKGHHQPLLLIYANPNANPISTTTAPKHITMIPGYSNKFNLRREVLKEYAETDSLKSDSGEVTSLSESLPGEESSGTESLQAQNTILSSHMKSPNHAKHKLLPVVISEPISEATKKSDHKKFHSKRHQKPKEGSSKFYASDEHKKTLQPEQSNVLSELSQSYIDKSSTPVDSNPTHATGTEIYKPKFTWKMTGEPSKKTPKMGQYVEPNPANWTTYKPYNVQSASGGRAPPLSKATGLSTNKEVSVKAVGQKGMAAFCVTKKPSTSKLSSHQRSLSPTSSLGLQSAVKQSPASLAKSLDKSSVKMDEVDSARSSRLSSASKPSDSGFSSHSSESTLASSDSTISNTGFLHAATDTTANKNVKSNLLKSPAPAQYVKTRPPLPPKPPFLSLPLQTEPCSDTNSQSQIATANSLPALATLAAMMQMQSQSPEFNHVNTVKSGSRDKFADLLQDAEDLIEQSRAADAILDYSSALQLCLEATKVVETILTMKDVPNEYLMQARIKHGECVNRGRILQRRKNIRNQSHSSESSGSRLSMVEADRHVAAMIKRSSSSNLSQSAKDGKVVEHMEKNESNENLINFDKNGVTVFQDKVEQIFEGQKLMKQHPNYREPIGLVSNGINTNNNNSGSGSMVSFSKENASEQSKSQNTSSNREDRSKTNIFVWNSPGSVGAETQPTQDKVLSFVDNNQRTSSSAIPTASPTRKVISDTNLRKGRDAKTNRNMRDPTDEEDLEVSLNQMSVDSSRKYRSVTPTPQGSINLNAAQLRRSKTPTPALNKKMLRSQRPSTSRVRPKSSYDVLCDYSIQNGRNSGASNCHLSKTSENDLESTNSMSNHPSSLPAFPYPAWNSSQIMSPGSFTPAMFPPGYYPYFFQMFQQYYASLSPEERSMLQTSANQSKIDQRPSFPASPSLVAPSAVQATYLEHLKAQFGGNFSAPLMLGGLPSTHQSNVNIYEANKPKPHNKAVSSTQISTRDTSVNNTLRKQSGNKVDSSQSNKPTQKNRAQNDLDKKSIIPPQSIQSEIDDGAASGRLQQPKTKEGMLKWAGEAKKRVPDTRVMPEYRNKILNEFAHRPRKNLNHVKQSVLQNYPVVEDRPSVTASQPNRSSTSNAVNQQRLTSKENDNKAKCQLCGLVPVAHNDQYCINCRAYLARFKPTVNSQRATRK
ncbi:uncharacterized protein LOC143469674 isoform X3 [Clavelina lepadiformis]|uniref:uncharacterized protein LOC143469674 isoform X3 n=1 Tax=Clavelina lepadiformis TaxID=159417 RepID=UPI004042CC7A